MTKEMTMAERISEQGGLFKCAFKTRNGRSSSACYVRAHSAREARKQVKKAVGCALLAFVVKAVCP